MMKGIFISVLLGFFVYNGNSQVYNYAPGEQQGQPDDSVPGKKVSYSFTTGASIISGKHIGTGSVFFFSPEITCNFSPRLIINSGLVVNQNNYSLPVAFIGDNRSVVVRQTPVASQNLFYASGDYELSPKLSLTGSIMTTFFSGTTSNAEESTLQNYFQSMSLGMSYKVNKYLTISAGMGIIHSTDLVGLVGNGHSN